MKIVIVVALLISSSLVLLEKAQADEAFAQDKRFYWGLGVGAFDADFEDSDLPHLNSSTGNLFTGYDISPYLSIEAQLEGIARDAVIDDDGFKTQFTSIGVAPALLVKYPLDRANLFEAYARLGSTYLAYEMSSAELGKLLEEKKFLTTFGAGIRGKHLYLEYVNYGKIQGLYLEQIRGGIRFSF